MERSQCRNLSDIWYDLVEKERLKVVVEIAKIEGILFSIPVPASGSVYYKADLPSETIGIDIARGRNDQVDAGFGDLCIGPDASQHWWYAERGDLDVPRGPCQSFDLGLNGFNHCTDLSFSHQSRTSLHRSG